MTPRAGGALLLLCAAFGCRDRARRAPNAERWEPPVVASPAPAQAPEPRTLPSTIPECVRDATFDGPGEVSVLHARYIVTLPDEQAQVPPAERWLEVDDEGHRVSMLFTGDGLPTPAGVRLALRGGQSTAMFIGATNDRYRLTQGDELTTWFLGTAPRAGTALTFQRSDERVVATRGGMLLVMSGDRRETAPHPLLCRLFVELLLGGDPAAARVGCATAAMPARVALFARGWQGLLLTRSNLLHEDVARSSLAMPPPGAAETAQLPPVPPTGSFFSETPPYLPGRVPRRGLGTLHVHNAMERTAIVFVDDLSVGWAAPGRTLDLEGVPNGRHRVHARSLEGHDRTRDLDVTVPGEVDAVLDPWLSR